MAFDRKLSRLLALEPDVAIISECAHTDILRRKTPNFRPSGQAWVGENPNKGLAVFTFGAYSISSVSDLGSMFPYIAPMKIKGPVSFNLLGVWACHNKPNSYKNGLGPLRRALEDQRTFILSSRTVVAGDFNDNVRWDRSTRENKHSTNVAKLTELGLASAYHRFRGVPQGAEIEPTIYWRNRKIDGPSYHIDYCFVPDEWVETITNIAVGAFDDWIAAGLSDHVPLIVDLALP